MGVVRTNILHGDSLVILPTLPDNSIDSCVTDPPYHLTSVVKRFGKADSAPAQFGTDGAFARASRGFMGKEWDGGDIAFRPEIWAEVLRVLKPGGHLLAFGGTRTYHRMACAIEDAGFEIRDMTGWLYGSGFPKSHNQHGDWEGWGTALKPAQEPICVARKPLIGTVAENLAAWGTGALNIDACRVETGERIVATRNVALGSSSGGVYGPAVVSGVYQQKDGGRWPANVIHDGSDEVLGAFPAAPGQIADASTKPGSKTQHVFGAMACEGEASAERRADSGSAARFFYCAKAGKGDRAGSKHPTVKPIKLMRYLCRLVTPPGGTVLDPFAGSGTTLQAAIEEGFSAIGIEREAEYLADINRRLMGLEMEPPQ